MILRHYVEFREAHFDRRLHRINIYDHELDSGTTTELVPQLPPVKLFYDSDDDYLCTAMRGSRLEIYVHMDDPEQYDYFFTGDKKRYEVIYLIDGDVYWRGFVEPELLEMPYTAPSVLTISCTCGLAYLKEVDYDPLDGDMQSFLDIIKQCLSNLMTSEPWGDLDIYDSVYIYPTDVSQNGLYSSLKNMYVYQPTFYRDDEWLCCYDVLKAIAERFDFYIKQGKEGFYLMQVNALKGNYYLRTLHLVSTNEEVSLIRDHIVEFDNQDIFWLDASQERSIEPGWENIIITQNFDAIENLYGDTFQGINEIATLPDYDINDNDGRLRLDVEAMEAALGEAFETTGSSNVLYELYQQTLVTDYIQSDIQYLYVRVYLKYVSNANMFATVKITNGSSTYYLNSNGNWQTSKTQYLSYYGEIGYHDIETSAPPISGDITIGFGMLFQTTTGDAHIGSYEVDINNSECQVLVTESEEITELEFVRETNSGYSVNYEMETYLGDADVVDNAQWIYKTGIFYLDSGEYLYVNSWTIRGAGDVATLNELIADEKATNYEFHIIRFEGTARFAKFDSNEVLQIGSKYYQIIACEIESLNNEVTLTLLSYNNV